MNAEAIEPDARPSFATMARVAQRLIQQKRCDVFSSDEGLAAEAGVSIDIVKGVLSGKLPDGKGEFDILRNVKGKDWQRLIAAAHIFPEDWIMFACNEADRSIPNKTSASDFLIAAGLGPTKEADAKIMKVLRCANSFYFQASTNYIQLHGTSPDAGKNAANNE
jgi:hypothetical protein